MKDVKKLLRSQAAGALPDDARVKENVRRELGFAGAEPVLAAAHGGTATAGAKKKWLPLAAAFLALALIAAVLLAVFLPGGSSSLGGGNKFLQISTADDFYAYGAASVGSLLSSESGGNASAVSARAASAAVRAPASPSAAANAADGTSDGHLTAEQEGLVNEYLALAEGLLSDGAIEHSIAGADASSGYDYVMTVTARDLLGSSVTYTMYYDQTLTGSETDDGEREDSYSLEGMLVLDGVSYPVTGGKVEESESGESETELWFRAETGENSYIRVEQELESETEGGSTETEQKYIYTIWRDGALAERTTVEYESEAGELELKMTVERRLSDGSRETDVLEFEREEEGGSTVLRVNAQMGGERVSFRVYIENGTYRYVFSDNTSSDHSRPSHGDDDDDDDEDDDDDDDD